MYQNKANTKETITYLTTQKKKKKKNQPTCNYTDKTGNKSQVTLPKGLTNN